MNSLTRLADSQHTSMAQFDDALVGIRIAKLDDVELIQLAETFLQFPTMIDELSQHAGYFKKLFDTNSFYHAVKGELTPRMSDNLAQKLRTFVNRVHRNIQDNSEIANRSYRRVAIPEYELIHVITHFRDLDIYDGRRFKSNLEGATLAVHCPEIVQDARTAFRHRWFNTKQVQADYEWGAKTVAELKEDGRSGMFLEGIANLNHYLRTR
ncbi:MAG: hypothetical protein AABX29_05885 [Nanoarchaeota archaeon]